MAMSQRSGGGYNHGRLRPLVRPNYEIFQPNIEWKHQHGAVLALLHLPGFIKEQIRLTKNESTYSIRVYGERGIQNRRRLRFSTSFSIPPDCDLNQLNTKFENGILTITIPKIPRQFQANNEGAISEDIEALIPQPVVLQSVGEDTTKQTEETSLEKNTNIDKKVEKPSIIIKEEEESNSKAIDKHEITKENANKFVKDYDEKRQLLVNIFVSIIVIVTLWIYIF